jgi:nicotinamide mononucleotide transporter
MIEILWEWLCRNLVEIIGAILGAIYVFLSIKQNVLTWLFGLLTSMLYVYVFFDSGFYADMSLQSYYVLVSIYGWIIWARGKETEGRKEELPVSNTSRKLFFILLPISLLLWILIYIVLKRFTDSIVPVGDSFTTALSIVATWMLARKKIEHWIVWVVVDAICMILFAWKGLYPTVVLYLIYTAAAVWGYFEWNKDIRRTKCLIKL